MARLIARPDDIDNRLENVRPRAREEATLSRETSLEGQLHGR